MAEDRNYHLYERVRAMELLLLLFISWVLIVIEMAFKKVFGISLIIVILLLVGIDCG